MISVITYSLGFAEVYQGDFLKMFVALPSVFAPGATIIFGRTGLTEQVLSRFGNEFLAASMNHYHIRWANSNVDWQGFQTKDEAVAEAERLKSLEENYKIEERDVIATDACGSRMLYSKSPPGFECLIQP